MKLEAKKLTFRYDSKRPWIFKDLSLEINSGEVVGLFGPSGKGKTTLARMLAGYQKPIIGDVMLNGAPLPENGFCPVQLIFQHPGLAINPKWPIKRVLAEAFEPKMALLERFGIQTDWLERYPHELSGGELQRIALARALTPKTRFIIADEITAMLDAITQAQIWHLMLELSKENKLGLLVVSHNLHLLKRICSRIEGMD